MYSPIIATLGYILSPDRTQTLLVHRNARPDDQHFGKYNGLGGKMLPGEDLLTCLYREISEEAGISCEKSLLRGTINWTGFGKEGESWMGFIFLVTRYSGTPLKNNEEGTLSWHPIANLTELPMWDGDRFFLPMVFDDDKRIFHGHMPYHNGKPIQWSYNRV